MTHHHQQNPAPLSGGRKLTPRSRQHAGVECHSWLLYSIIVRVAALETDGSDDEF
jgi:hypothetical protein